MIIELTLENFKSFLQPTTIRFAANTSSRLSGNLLQIKNGERFVKSMALYGPNASGKTTTLDGLYALRRFVLFSSKDQKPTSEIPHFVPFALDCESTKRPSRICIVIELNGDRYTFEVSATSSQVWKEAITVQRIANQPGRKVAPIKLMDREWDPNQRVYKTYLHDDMGSKLTQTAAIEQTTPNRLMLGKFGSMNSAIARRIIEWFDDDLYFYDMHRNPGSEGALISETARLLKSDSEFAKTFEQFMKDADTGIEELRINEEKVIEAVISESDEKMDFKEFTKPGLSFRHFAEDGSEVYFRRNQESSGTLRFVALLAAILRPSQRRRLICIDEISASMHPELVRRLILLIHSGRYNTSGSQVLFTTHDTHLMDPGELLRRDQVVICNKDRFGRSSARRLDEFQDSARSDANLQKQYLQGRFGGLPRFGPTLEDVPVDEAPLEIGP